MWSAMTRRVKGIMVGHERGVRSLDFHDTTLLSASFELDARTWDLNSKENVAILRGHRKPIVAAKLMCALAHVEKDHRAVTVDESGEMRLWNIFVAERASDPVLVPTLQIFSMLNPEYPMKYIKLLAVPYIGSLSQSYYSDVVGCSTRMMHFVPEKNVKEFIPPSSAAFSEAAAEYVVAVGKKLIKYDVCKGIYVGSFEPNPNTDLTALSLELPRCRRLFVGCSNGDVMIFAYDQGCILDSVNAHNKEVTCILIHNGNN
jgi:WD40 repeat protein